MKVVKRKYADRSNWLRILDKDELDEALSEGCITEEDYDKANEELNKVIHSEIIDPEFLRKISNRYILLLR